MENRSGGNSVAAIFGSKPFPTDQIWVAKFTVIKSEKGKGSNMMFGASAMSNPTTEWVGGPRGLSWSVNRNTGMKCFRGSGKDYAKGLKNNVNGDTIEVVIDAPNGEILFVISGKQYGVAYREAEAFARGDVYPAISINDKTDKVSFDYFGPLR